MSSTISLSSLDPQSCNVNSMDWGASPVVQNAIERSVVKELTIMTGLPNSNTSSITFRGEKDSFMCPELGSIYFLLEVKILDSQKKPLLATEKVGPVNLFPYALFSDIEVKINNVKVTPETSNFAYISYVLALTNLSQGFQNSVMQTALFYKDTPFFFDNFAPDANDGLKERTAFVSGSRLATLYMKPFHSVFNSSRCLPTDTLLQVTLTRQNHNFSLIAVKGKNYTIQIQNIRMFCNYVKPTQPSLSNQDRFLSSGKFYIPTLRHTLFQNTIKATDTSHQWTIIPSGHLPKRVYVFMVKSDAVSGANIALNPFNFLNNGVSNFRLYKNDEAIFATEGISGNFAASEYVSFYLTLFTGLAFQNPYISIPYSDYPGGYAIWIADLTASDSSSCSSYIEQPTDGTIKMRLTFDAPIKNDTTIFALCEESVTLTLDKNRIPSFI